MSENDRRIDYVEFPAADLDAVKRFYGAVFGWTFTDYGPEYTSFADGRLSGGFDATQQQTGARGALVVIYADDLEAMHERVLREGGRIVRPLFSFPGGRRFHFADPAGNELAVWSDR